MVKIITDSSTLYTMQEGRDAGIESIPLCVSIGDSHGRDLQMDMQDFYRRIEEGQIPTSSQPPIGDVLDAYEQYKGRPILNISMADGLSGTYQSAQSAREMAENRDDIMVFNSRTLCGPHRYMVDQARKMAEEGRTRDEILTWLKAAAHKTESFLIPQDFSFGPCQGQWTASSDICRIRNWARGTCCIYPTPRQQRRPAGLRTCLQKPSPVWKYTSWS